jgi:Ala-tRNA(Pro) deacylase
VPRATLTSHKRLSKAMTDLATTAELEARCLNRLNELGLAHQTVHHPPVYTVEEAKRLRCDLPGAHVKNLFLCDRKKRSFFLLTALENQKVSLKGLAALLEVHRGLRFANEGHLLEKLGVSPGSVTPLAVMNDTEGCVQMLLDENLRTLSPINAHPLHNAATTSIPTDDLLRFMDACGHPPRWVDLSDMESHA